MSWVIEPGEGDALAIHHRGAPRFRALWVKGELPETLLETAQPVWTDEGHGHEDVIHLFSFHWIDRVPDQTCLERLMVDAVRAIEMHITGST
ncbi:MAG: hypothetical protein AAF264_02685 [Pseudomonadota bacterium]